MANELYLTMDELKSQKDAIEQDSALLRMKPQLRISSPKSLPSKTPLSQSAHVPAAPCVDTPGKYAPRDDYLHGGARPKRELHTPEMLSEPSLTSTRQRCMVPTPERELRGNMPRKTSYIDSQSRKQHRLSGEPLLRGDVSFPYNETHDTLRNFDLYKSRDMADHRPITPSQSTKKVKPDTYNGSSSWIDFKTHFEMCAVINNWSYTEKGMYLAVSLRGLAQGVLGNLPEKDKSDYGELTLALQQRFSPINQTELYRSQLKSRYLRPGESLPELGQGILRLTQLAYPRAPPEMWEVLAKDAFIDALTNSEIRLRVQQSRPTNLNDAIRTAVELEAFEKAERCRPDYKGQARVTEEVEKSVVSKESDNLATLQAMISKLQADVESLKESYKPFRKRGKECYKCGKLGHFRRDCPENDKAGNAKDHASVGAGYQQLEAGLYVKTDMYGETMELLVDTGATITMISKEIYDQIPFDRKPALEPIEKGVLAANGEEIPTYGKTVLDVTIGGKPTNIDAVVADITAKGLLGLDFLRKHNCRVDLLKNCLTIGGEEIPCRLVGRFGCARVHLAETITIPGRHELVVSAGMEKVLTNRVFGLVEPLNGEAKTGHTFLGRTLAWAADKVPIRLLNPSDEPQVLYKGTTVGVFEPVVGVVRQSAQGSDAESVPSHLEQLFNATTPRLSKKQTQSVKRLLCRFGDLFSKDDQDLGKAGIVKHRIDTGNSRPVKQPPRRLPHHFQIEADKQVGAMLEKDIIRPSTGPWASGIVLVRKKDGSLRFCVDYRQLNNATVKDAYPLPRIDESLDCLGGKKWFCTLDLSSGYWQIEMDPRDKHKTAFVTRSGLFEFNVLPFGLCNAPATFERLMETVLSGLQWQICLIYLDDIIVHGRSFEECMDNLEQVFGRLAGAGLKLKPRKCTLFANEVSFLGHIVSGEGIATDPAKTKVVREWPVPLSVTQVRSFLGFCSYYRKFIRHFARIAHPLNVLTMKGQAFVWSEACQHAFEVLKAKLTTAPILAHPNFDIPFILDTDACDVSIGAVLSQEINGIERPVCYGNKALTKSERRYCVTRRELLAVVHFIRHFRYYLTGKRFLVRTDHSALRWLLKKKDAEGQTARWIETLSSFEFDIQHRPGKSHGNADGLSRIPCAQCDKQPGDFRDTYSGQHVRIALRSRDVGDDVSSKQENDRAVKLLKNWLRSSKRPDWREVSSEGGEVKSYWSQFQRFSVRDGIVCRDWTDVSKKVTTWQPLVPREMRVSVLTQAHDSKTGGHLGITKCLKKIRQKYYWPGLQKDVRQWILGCEKCQRGKRMNPPKAPLQMWQSGLPMERIAVDITGPLPMTVDGNQYIMVVADYFTKWTEAFAMPNQEALTVANILVQEVMTRFGIPLYIHSDQGRQFESILFTEICDLLGVQKTRTTPYHPQSDGMVERFNRTLKEMMREFVSENQTDWDVHLPYLLMAYRASVHESTNFTPNYLMMGREVSTPLDLVVGRPPDENQTVCQWVSFIRDSLLSAYTYVRKFNKDATLRQKRYYDTKTRSRKLKPDDRVWVYFPTTKPGTSPKLTSYWRGPYVVTRMLSDVTYEVRPFGGGKLQIVHIDRLKPCLTRTGFRNDNVDQESENLDAGERGSATACSGRPRRPSFLPRKFEEFYMYYAFAMLPDKYLLPFVSLQEMRPRLPFTPNLKFACFACGRRFRDVWALQRHLSECADVRTRNSHQQGGRRPTTPEKDTRRRYPCQFCDQTLSRRSDVKRHITRQHPGAAATSATDTRKVIPAASAGSSGDKPKDAATTEQSGGEVLAPTAQDGVHERSEPLDDIGSDPGITLSSVPPPISPISTPVTRGSTTNLRRRRTLHCQPSRRDVGVQCTLLRVRRQRREFEKTKTRVVDGETIVERTARFASWTDLDEGESSCGDDKQ